MDMNSCIKGSVALTKVALKSHYVKQDLKIGEGILAALSEQWREHPPRVPPFELTAECPAPRGCGLDRGTLCAKTLSDSSFLPLFRCCNFRSPCLAVMLHR